MTASRTDRLVSREDRVQRAFFRGAGLTLANPNYLSTLCAFTSELLRTDLYSTDITVEALGIGAEQADGIILAREDGVAAGIDEALWLLRSRGMQATQEKRDGELIKNGDVLIHLAGSRGDVLALERVTLNLLQRMSGIATTAHRLQNQIALRDSSTRVVATRKTPWGLLDKRAVHLGGCGTHRIGLGDAILIKNNHLALIANDEAEAAPIAIHRAWPYADKVLFIEVEVRSERAARIAAAEFQKLLENSPSDCPCLILLDNMSPSEIQQVTNALENDGLRESVVIEASGGIAESNIEEYATCGADAISVGALTHSAVALDVSERIS